MKETSANIENEVRKYFLAEFSLDDGEYEITFNIIDISVHLVEVVEMYLVFVEQSELEIQFTVFVAM